MVQILIALAGAGILTVILLVLPSVFSKKITLLHVFLAVVYFFLGLFINQHFHWAVAAVAVFLLVLSTAFILMKQSYVLNSGVNEKQDF